VDLRHTAPPPTDVERAAVDAVLGPAPREAPPMTAAQVKALRTQLLPALVAVQARLGWVSEGALGYACARLGVPPAEGYGVASFYALLALGERPKAFAHVCDDVACRAAGAARLCDDVARALGPAFSAPHRAEPGQPHPKTEARWARSPCLGLCEQAPAALVTVAGDAPVEQAFGGATVARVEAALRGEAVPALPCVVGALGPRRLLARVGVADPTSLDDYRGHGGYGGLRAALDAGPEWVIREVTASKLAGRGGAAFPTGRKWDAVSRASSRTRFLVCNADESEPGTFKDRALLEGDPFAVLEAMTVAAFAVGAERGYVYLRGEYPLARARLERAIAAARAAGLLGDDVLGRGLRFDVELRVGAGAYVCGEETALFNSIEGYRGEPRTKPPFPAQAGLFGQPTCVNNVETLVAALDVVRRGAAAQAEVGTAGSPGTRLFCLSGAVHAPGVYEVPYGTTLGALLELAGGVRGRLQAILLGGAAGSFVGPDALSLPLALESARAAGVTLGSGVVLVLDDGVDLKDQLQRLAAFFRDESCGQCVPCRVGTVRQQEVLARLARGAPRGSVADELSLLAELGQVMRDASICGLGQTASSAVESAVKLGVFEVKR
jgi:NADH-quinone oxidoreductase subunit F